MTRIALLTALSLILFVLEGFLPLPLPVPGAKLGLAAIVTLIALHLLPTRDAALMLMLRIFLASALWNISSSRRRAKSASVSFLIVA